MGVVESEFASRGPNHGQIPTDVPRIAPRRRHFYAAGVKAFHPDPKTVCRFLKSHAATGSYKMMEVYYAVACGSRTLKVKA